MKLREASLRMTGEGGTIMSTLALRLGRVEGSGLEI